VKDLLRTEGTRRLTRDDRYIEAHAGQYIAAGGERGVVILLEDVTEQVRTESARAEAERHSRFLAEQAQHSAERIRRINQELEQFAFVASHDLQEPLRTIAGFAQLLARRFKGQLGEEADDYIGNIVQGAKRMQALIQDLLDYSRVGRDEALETSQVDMNQVFDEAIESLRASLTESGGEVTREALPVLPQANESQMAQLLTNLLSNAIKYRRFEVPPRVHVSAAQRGDMWHFSVADNGQGFSPEFADLIFGVFKRLHGREVPGTGIGLALCKRIVDRHGGRIWAESRPDEGSIFHFTLPA
jgi:light-regulated signal transduction histidine kinase (bacteriophytochrome)